MPTDKAIANPTNVQIFYDESGKQHEKTQYMGAILIPKRTYKDKNDHKELNKLIKEGTRPLHFTDYNGYGKSPERFKKLHKLNSRRGLSHFLINIMTK